VFVKTKETYKSDTGSPWPPKTKLDSLGELLKTLVFLKILRGSGGNILSL
jgi:hypothetical protein